MDCLIYINEIMVKHMDKITEQEFCLAVRKESKSMFRLAYGILHNAADAEDAVSEAVLKAWKNINTVRDAGRLKNWMLAIVINEAKNMSKKAKREVAVEEIFDYLNAYETPERRSDILDSVSYLKEKYRIVIFMYYFNEMTVKNIAEILKISEGTVKSRLNRARAQLKHILENRNDAG